MHPHIGVFFELFDVQPILSSPRLASLHDEDRRPEHTHGAAKIRLIDRNRDCDASRPKNLRRCVRARKSKREIRLIASGCKNLLESGVTGKFVFLGGGYVQQLLNHVVCRDAVALRSKIDRDPVSQYWLGQRLDIFG